MQVKPYHHSRHASLGRPTPQVRFGRLGLRIGLLVLAVAGVVLQYGFTRPLIGSALNHWLQLVLTTGYGLDLWLARRNRQPIIQGEQLGWLDSLILGVGAAGVVLHTAVHLSWALHVFELCMVLLLFLELWRLNAGLSQKLSSPGMLLPLSFLFLIIVGMLLIQLPRAQAPGMELSWLDALFTMTSAVCVTGLSVNDISQQFSLLGQVLIAIFIQIGGLGIIIFGSMLAVLMGARLTLRENTSLSQMLSDQPLRRTATLVKVVVASTLLFELIGAAALMPLWQSPGGAEALSLKQRAGLSLFHAVSAFCNAGFALQSDNLAAYRYEPLMHSVILPLIVLGGLGLPVLDNLGRISLWHARRIWGRWRGRRLPDKLADSRLNLHTRVVLVTTGCLYLFGVVLLAVGQIKPYVVSDSTMQAQQRQTEPVAGAVATADPGPLTLRTLGRIVADSSFMSISARTAGFNSLPMQEISPAGQLTLMTLMIVGGSPGGTAGGMKTTTIALLLLALAATVRQRESTEAFGRCISDQLVRKAATLAFSMVGLVILGTLLLSLSEPFPLSSLLFEVISALTTTGLSLGITSQLTGFGKLVIIALMFLGRVGPLALLASLFIGSKSMRPYAYPYEDVAIG